MSRVEHIRAAINYLDAVRYETGNECLRLGVVDNGGTESGAGEAGE